MYKILLSFVASTTLVSSLAAKETILNPIVISATKTEQSLKEITTVIELITAEEIQERHYTTLIEALNSLAGIDFTQSGGIGQQSSVFVRGFANKYTLVLIDGMRINDVTNFDGALFDQIHLGDVERIEVIKGAQSGIWGADAVSGVINIITKKARPHHVNGYAETGSYGTRKFGTTLSHATGKGDIKLGFDRILTDGFSSAEPKKSDPLYGTRFDTLGWERDGYAATTLHAKAGFNLTDSDRIELSHRRVSSHLRFDSAGVDKPYAIETGPWGDTDYANTFTQRFTKASYRHTQGKTKMEAYAGRSDFEREYYGGYRGKVDEAGLTGTLSHNDGGALTAGATWQRFGIDTAGGTHLKNDYIGRALFVSNTNLFNNGNTVLSETLRYDNYSVFGAKTTGKIGLKHTLQNSSLSINYGTAYLAPSLIQIANPYGAPNPDLKPEDIRSFDITASYRNLSLTYFHNTIKNMINWYDPDGWSGPLAAYYTNTEGTSTLQGYEAKIKQPIGNTLFLSGAYTHLRALDSTGNELPRRPRDTLKTWIDWYPSDALHLGINAQYVGTRYDNAAQTIETGNYAVFGGVLNYTINPQFDVYAKFDNIFDRYYQVIDGYATAGRSGYIGIKVNY